MSDRRGGRLDSWKEIADHIGRDVRTAIRWEQERGLPVHRVPGGRRGTVFAYSAEIDAWLGRTAEPDRPQSPPPPPAGDGSVPEARRRTLGTASGALAAAALSLLLLALILRADVTGWGRSRGPVAAILLEASRLVAFDGDQRVLWEHDFGRRVLKREDPQGRPRPSLFSSSADLDRDGRLDLVVTVPFDDDGSTMGQDELFAFSATGRVLWSRRLEDVLAFGSGTFSPPWRDAGPPVPHAGRQVATFEVDGQPRVAWAQCHRTWWPSLLTVLDASGRPLSRWVHSGVIYEVASASGATGPVLLVGGVSNSREAAFFAVLDARRVEGSGPEEPGSPFECLSCGPGRPLRYFVIPPSEQRLASGPYNETYRILPDAQGVEVHTAESSATSAYVVEAIARFSTGFDLEHVAWSSAWSAGHRELERAGKLDHPLDRCPERGRSPRVREWAAQSGWREVRPEPTRLATAKLTK